MVQNYTLSEKQLCDTYRAAMDFENPNICPPYYIAATPLNTAALIGGIVGSLVSHWLACYSIIMEHAAVSMTSPYIYTWTQRSLNGSDALTCAPIEPPAPAGVYHDRS